MEPAGRSWISFVTLGVADLERAARFYAEALELPRLPSPPEPCFFDLGAVRLALYPRHLLAAEAGVPAVLAGGTGFAGFALSYNVASRQEVDRLLAAADAGGAGGGRLVRPGYETAWGGYAGWLADPDGFLWEVVWNPKWSAGSVAP